MSPAVRGPLDEDTPGSLVVDLTAGHDPRHGRPQDDPELAAADALAPGLDALQRRLTDDPGTPLPAPPTGTASARVRAAFDLDDFSWGVVLLAAAVELVPGTAALVARLPEAEGRPHPTLGVALAHLPEPRWAALTPAAPLRAHGVIELGPGDVLTARPVHLRERVLHALLGADHLDPALADRLLATPAASALPAPLSAAAAELAEAWVAGRRQVHLWVGRRDDGTAVAAEAAVLLGRSLHRLPAAAAPRSVEEAAAVRLAWAREHRLSPLALAVDLDDAAAAEVIRDVTDLAARLDGPVVTMGREPQLTGRTHLVRVPAPSFAEQRAHWSAALAAADLAEPDALDDLVARFGLSPAGVDAAIAATAEGGEDPNAPGNVARGLWQRARVLAHPQLEDLAQRVEVRATWDDLVLPPAQSTALRALLAQARQRATVEHRWGFAERGRPGTSAAVLAGPSGTGKTLAAEVLANELRLDLFRIDLSAVVSKYIGETEKNLRRVFDAAEAGGAVLLFDEADALFGKRTEVSDSHDRHANIEVSYLLQRLESFTGLALLTTNHRDHLDDAFLRRIPFAVDFPFPDLALRRAIWARAFPASAPVEGIDLDRLARLVVAGGSIRSIARNAAFMAADAGQPIDMTVLRRAAGLEADKLGRPLSPTEVRGWT